MFAPSLFLQLFSYRRSVLEKELRCAVRVDRQLLNEGVPQPFAEVYRQRLHPANVLYEPVEDFDLLSFPFLAVRDRFELCLQVVIPFDVLV